MPVPADLPRRRSTPRAVWVTAFVLFALVLAGAGLVYWRALDADSPIKSWLTGSAPSTSATASSGRVGAGRAPGAGQPRSARAQAVRAAEVKRLDMRQWVKVLGTLTALNTAIVRPKVDGELVAVLFKEGQRVQAGDVLARIESSSFKAQVMQAQGQLAKDAALLANARLDLERYQGLLAKGAIARQQVESQQSLVAQLQGTVEADQAQLELARMQLGHTEVRAPISGVLGLRQVDLGSLVRSSDANGLVSITQTQPMTVVFAIPERHVGDLRLLLNAKRAVKVQAWSRDDSVLLAQGEVASTDNAIDTATGTLKVKATLPNPQATLFPNQFANVRLLLKELKGTLAVPVPAIQRGALGTFVYVVEPGGKVRIEKVQLKMVEGAWQAIDGALKPGEQVVTDGGDRLRSGSQVEVVQLDTPDLPPAEKP